MKRKSKNSSIKKESNIISKVLYYDGKFDLLALFKNILMSLGGGIIVSLVVRDTIYIYDVIKKPIFTPPKIVFLIVWSLIYIIIGIAAYRIYMNNKLGKNDFGAYFYYLNGLLLNFLWPILFFGLRLYGLSFILIIVLLIFTIITMVKFLKVDKISGILIIPYVLWVSFASTLNFFIWVFNEM